MVKAKVDENSYEGGAVLKPFSGKETEVVVFDFEGLYPSVQLSENLDGGNMIQDSKYLGLPGKKYLLINFGPKRSVIYVQGYLGIVNRFLLMALNGRAIAKKILAQYNDRMNYFCDILAHVFKYPKKTDGTDYKNREFFDVIVKNYSYGWWTNKNYIFHILEKILHSEIVNLNNAIKTVKKSFDYSTFIIPTDDIKVTKKSEPLDIDYSPPKLKAFFEKCKTFIKPLLENYAAICNAFEEQIQIDVWQDCLIHFQNIFKLFEMWNFNWEEERINEQKTYQIILNIGTQLKSKIDEKNSDQNTFKGIANSVYGMQAAGGTDIWDENGKLVRKGINPNVPVSAAITYIGRNLIKQAYSALGKKYNAAILYGDTDSCFVKFPPTVIPPGPRGVELSFPFMKYEALPYINNLFKFEGSIIRMQHEKTCVVINLTDAKKVYSMLYCENPEDGPKLLCKGMKSSKRDSAIWIQKIGDEVNYIYMQPNSGDECFNHLRKRINLLLEHNTSDFNVARAYFAVEKFKNKILELFEFIQTIPSEIDVNNWLKSILFCEKYSRACPDLLAELQKISHFPILPMFELLKKTDQFMFNQFDSFCSKVTNFSMDALFESVEDHSIKMELIQSLIKHGILVKNDILHRLSKFSNPSFFRKFQNDSKFEIDNYWTFFDREKPDENDALKYLNDFIIKRNSSLNYNVILFMQKHNLPWPEGKFDYGLFAKLLEQNPEYLEIFGDLFKKNHSKKILNTWDYMNLGNFVHALNVYSETSFLNRPIEAELKEHAAEFVKKGYLHYAADGEYKQFIEEYKDRDYDLIQCSKMEIHSETSEMILFQNEIFAKLKKLYGSKDKIDSSFIANEIKNPIEKLYVMYDKFKNNKLNYEDFNIAEKLGSIKYVESKDGKERKPNAHCELASKINERSPGKIQIGDPVNYIYIENEFTKNEHTNSKAQNNKIPKFIRIEETEEAEAKKIPIHFYRYISKYLFNAMNTVFITPSDNKKYNSMMAEILQNFHTKKVNGLTNVQTATGLLNNFFKKSKKKNSSAPIQSNEVTKIDVPPQKIETSLKIKTEKEDIPIALAINTPKKQQVIKNEEDMQVDLAPKKTKSQNLDNFLKLPKSAKPSLDEVTIKPTQNKTPAKQVVPVTNKKQKNDPPVETTNSVTLSFYKAESVPFGVFSNFYPCIIKIDNKTWKSVEHYYQASKFKVLQLQNLIENCETPELAAEEGTNRDYKQHMKENWDKLRIEIMKNALFAKFSQNSELQKTLVNTKNAKLVCRTHRDSYWGDGENKLGKNMLGVLLMEVRNSFQK